MATSSSGKLAAPTAAVFAAGLLLGLAVSSLLMSRRGGGVGAGGLSRNKQIPSAFCLFVVVEFATQTDKEHFADIFRPLAEYVRDHEAGTASYILSESDKNPLRVHILERYVDKQEAFVKAHRNSPAFTTFRSVMAKMQETKQITLVEGNSYIERNDLGFV